MDSFGKGFSSQPPASPKLSISGETKENDVNHDNLGSNFKSQNPKKPVTKHFMSPTISATSKVTVPRTKILAEKNESTTSCDNAHYPKSLILDAKNGLHYTGLGASPHCDQTSSWADPACVNASVFYDGEVNNCFADSSVRPYDPLTNYLSPRPKFLRYKPNRRREILQRSGIFSSRNQKIVDEQKSSECDQEELLDSSPQEDADGDEDEESEEDEVPNCWCLKGLAKFLVLLVVIGLSTSYISSMNNPRPSTVVQATGGLMEGYHRIQKHLFEAVYSNVHGSPWQNGSERTLGFTLDDDHELGRYQIDLDDEEEWDESTDEIIEIPEPPTGEFEDISEDDEGCHTNVHGSPWQNGSKRTLGFTLDDDHELGRYQIDLDDEEEWDESTDEIIEIPEPPTGEFEDISEDDEGCHTNVHGSPWQNGSKRTLGFTLDDDHELGRYQIDLDDEEEWDESTDEIIEIPEPPTGEFEDISEDDERDEELICPDWKSAEIINDKVKETNEASDQFPVFENAQTDAATDQELNEVEKDSEGLQQCASLERKPANLIFRADQLENDHKADQIEGAKAGEEMTRNRPERIEDATTIRDGENYDKAEELNRIYVEDETNETELQLSEATISGVGDEIFLPAKIEIDDDTQAHTRRFEIGGKSIKDLNFLDLEPIAIAMIIFSIFSIILACLVYRYRLRAIPAPLHDPQLKASDRKEKLIQAQVCGQVEHAEERAESILKPSSMSFPFEKGHKETYIHAPDIELLGEFVIGEFSTVRRSLDRKGRTIETGETIYSVSHGQSRAQPVARAQTPNVSSTGSPSYGSFTAEKIMLKKKEGGREGNVKAITTPVRRSSRIRNLSATSP
ncbi:unnamed protein product [Coffea canephora]|uniref:Uncharacterized protein n=1 Tax=Coffea canephora TaxID=49390 RepID=A0A068TNY5_COFCA|nr:unnamed protein product [Coffea canephora]